jgi:molybdate transport system substrate-binding protein
VRPRIVLGENVSQAAQFVESAAADVGVIALSLALAPRLDRAGRFALVADELYPPIEQGAVVLETAGERAAAAQAFLDHVLGPEGQAILQRHGFLPPEA